MNAMAPPITRREPTTAITMPAIAPGDRCLEGAGLGLVLRLPPELAWGETEVLDEVVGRVGGVGFVLLEVVWLSPVIPLSNV